MTTTKTTAITILTLLIAFLGSPSYGYELSTHGALVREAYDRSTLQTPDWMTRLGVGNGSADLGNVYLDMSSDGTTITLRLNNPVEIGKEVGTPNFTLDNFKGANKLAKGIIPAFQSPEGWMMVGAIREDDVVYDKGAWGGINPPQDDPQGAFNRLYNHFYDPYLGGIPLQGGPISGVAAPDWAIDGKGLSKDNHFSIKSAREAMFRAATLRTLDNGQLKALNTPQGVSLNEQQQRLAYWAAAFRSLGDVSHLLQDMAQPQHTRNVEA